jgi:4-diphosphocytidyl-2-C-methyl-D-erythritol kinase
MSSMETISLKAPAKINLYLRVLGRRADGYHDIESLMSPISLNDTITLEPRTAEISVSCPGHLELEGRDNLAYRAASAFAQASAQSGDRQGVNICIDKKIPIAAGLGGGSSDAASTLIGLNKLAKKPMAPEKLHNIAAQLGADVPFFLKSGPCVARGVGNKLEKVDGLAKFWVLLACAPFGLSTRQVYESLNLPLTSMRSDGTNCGPVSFTGFDQLAACLHNDLQQASARLRPEIGKVCKDMIKSGASGGIMTGSGPTVFGLFRSEDEARTAQTRIERELEWQYLVAKG